MRGEKANQNAQFLAREIAEKRLDLDTLAERDANEAHNLLTCLHGVGLWTADVYLLFCLRHSDAWPAGDLAVQEGLRLGLGACVHQSRTWRF